MRKAFGRELCGVEKGDEAFYVASPPGRRVIRSGAMLARKGAQGQA
jgi:hypothetical protein